jgi:hypothetical protein
VPQSNFPFIFHDPYHHIENFLVNIHGHTNITSAIEIHREHIQSLKTWYGIFAPDLIDYDNIFSQNAYMMFYYPLYIETIAHVLSRVPLDAIKDILSGDTDVCIYGGGAIPEFFGFLYFVNGFYTNSSRITFHNFDLYNWDEWRGYLVRKMTSDYWTYTIPEVKSYKKDFCDLTTEEKYEQVPIIKTAKIHIFQNCLTEFIRKTGSVSDFKILFSAFLHSIPNGSLIIFINIVNFDRVHPESGMDVQARLADIEKIFTDNEFGETLHQISFSDPYIYRPNINRNNAIVRDVIPKQESKYHTLVLKKIVNFGEIHDI